jgi:ABC-2 type transport system permease protein
MKAYLSIFRMRLLNGLQYRVAALAGIVTQFFFGFIFLMIFLAFQGQNPSATSLKPGQLASYVWLQQAFLTFIIFWFRDNELITSITSGNLAYEFCRPVDLYGNWFVRLAAQRVAAAALRCLPILVVASFLPAPYGLSLPADPAALVLFLACLSLGLGVMVGISIFVYLGIIVTQSPMAMLILAASIGDFCSGLIIPLPFMPEVLYRVLQVLPFRLTADLPFRTWSGHIGHIEALWGIAAQLAWLGILVFTGRLAMRRISRKLVIMGG